MIKNVHFNVDIYRNNNIKDPEPLKFCRRFERFAANLVQCLSEASFARKICESATVQNGEHKFLVWILYIIISFFSYTFERLPFKLKFTLVSIPNTYSYTAMHSSPKIHLYSYRERPYHPSLLYSQSSKSWLY